MNFTLRAKRADLGVAWGLLLLWIIVVSLLYTFDAQKIVEEKKSGQELATQILLSFMVLFFLAWLLLSILAIIHCIRYRVHIAGDAVEKVGIFRRKPIDLNDVVKARWDRYRPGSLTLQTAATKLSVDFSKLTAEQAPELILFFRRRFSESIQEGWEKFWESNWPLFDEKENRSPEELATEQQTMKVRMWGCFLSNLILVAAISYWIWRMTGETKNFINIFLVLSALIQCYSILIFLFVKYFSPISVGRITKTQPKHLPSWIAVLCLYAGMTFYILVIALGIVSPEFWYIVVLFIVSPAIFSDHKRNRLRKHWNREAAQKAAELYLKPSPSTPSEP